MQHTIRKRKETEPIIPVLGRGCHQFEVSLNHREKGRRKRREGRERQERGRQFLGNKELYDTQAV